MLIVRLFLVERIQDSRLAIEMCHICHNQLIRVLLRISAIDNVLTRDTLLTGISISSNFERDRNNTWNDLSRIINQIAPHTLQMGEKPLRIFIDNAKERFEGTQNYDKLEVLYLEYDQSIQTGQCSKHNGTITANGASSGNHSSTAISPAYHLGDPHHFDLNGLMAIFTEKVLEADKIVGFAIPCDYTQFLHIFCNRVKNTMQQDEAFRDMVDIRQLYSARYNDSAGLVEKIKAIKFKNPHRYIVIPIKLGAASNDLVQQIWQRIYDEFSSSTQHVLIIILAGRSDCVFPANMTPLTPAFSEEDVYYWMLKVRLRLGWELDPIKTKWKPQMLDTCRPYGTKVLDMECTYTYISDVMQILQEETNIGFDDFMYLLEQKGATL